MRGYGKRHTDRHDDDDSDRWSTKDHRGDDGHGNDHGDYGHGGYGHGDHAKGGHEQGGHAKGGHEHGNHAKGGHEQGGHAKGGHEHGGHAKGGHDGNGHGGNGQGGKGHDDCGHEDSGDSVFSPKVERLLNKILGEETVQNAEEFYFADVKALPGFEANGKVLMAFDDDTDTLTVVVAARDIEANMPHLQHIHGFTDNITDSKSPTLAQDDDGDGIVELAEGLDTYGPILVNLTAPPGSGASGFPVADEDGTYFFRETYQLPSEMLSANPQLTLREIVLHGQTLAEGQGSNGGEADGTAGFKVALPVSSGEIQNITALDDVGFLKGINKIMKQTEGGVTADGGGFDHHDFAHA